MDMEVLILLKKVGIRRTMLPTPTFYITVFDGHYYGGSQILIALYMSGYAYLMDNLRYLSLYVGILQRFIV